MNGSSQNVMLNTDPEGATLLVGGLKVQSPTSLELKRDQDYFIKAVKEGYDEGYMPINKQLSGWFWFGIIMWGVFECISLGTGGAYKLSPDNVLIELQKKPTSSEFQPQPMQLVPENADTESLKNIEEEINKLEKMKADGLLTEEEYSKLKKKIIDKY